MLIDETLTIAIMVSILIVVALCSITDIVERRIYNSVLLPSLMLAFLFNSLLSGLPGILHSVLGLIVGMAILFPLYFCRGTSAGDVKLLGVVGAFLGAKGAVTAGLATLCFGGALGIAVVGWRMLEPTVALYIAQIAGPNGLPGFPRLGSTGDTPPWKAVFPYAPAIACGSLFALWHLGHVSLILG